MEKRECKSCKKTYPLNKDNFGHTPSGGFRWKCRFCKRKSDGEYAKNNPENVNTRMQRRRLLSVKDGGLTPAAKNEIREQLVIQQDGVCYFCRSKLTERIHIDHLQPLERGGDNKIENLVVACSKCNQEKHAKTVDEYRQWLRARNYQVKF